MSARRRDGNVPHFLRSYSVCPPLVHMVHTMGFAVDGLGVGAAVRSSGRPPAPRATSPR